jgi:hypothetical protein
MGKGGKQEKSADLNSNFPSFHIAYSACTKYPRRYSLSGIVTSTG